MPHAEGSGQDGRRQPFAQISQAESLASPGDVIVSREVAEVVEGHCELEPCESNDGNMHMLGFFTESEEVRDHFACVVASSDESAAWPMCLNPIYRCIFWSKRWTLS